MPYPSTMNAVLLHQPGGPEVLEYTRTQTPTPAADDVLIKVQAAGVNRADIWQRMGRYPVKTNDNPIPGLEVAGEIVATGANVTHWKVGDKVCTLTNNGGYAEYVAAPAVQLLRWPRHFTAIQTASLPESTFTVWANVFQAGKLEPGETVLIHGGRGGVGSMAIALASQYGATVLATSGSDDGCQDCLDIGADAAINYRDQNIEEVVAEITNNEGADVILDPIGAANLNANISMLAMDGRLVIIGFTGGAKADQVKLTPILTRRLTVTGSAMKPRTPQQKGHIARQLEENVWPWLDQDELPLPIAATFPLAEAEEAHRMMEAGDYFGKIMLTTDFCS